MKPGFCPKFLQETIKEHRLALIRQRIAQAQQWLENAEGVEHGSCEKGYVFDFIHLDTACAAAGQLAKALELHCVDIQEREVHREKPS